MGGFSDFDWSGRAATGHSHARRRRVPIEQYVVRVTLSPPQTSNRVIVERSRRDLLDTAQRWADGHGYEITEVRWENHTEDGYLTFTLVSQVSQRRDGEWPAIRAAIEEDEADRAAARTPAGRAAAALGDVNDAAETVSGRLDALKEAVGVWSDRSLRGL